MCETIFCFCHVDIGAWITILAFLSIFPPIFLEISKRSGYSTRGGYLTAAILNLFLSLVICLNLLSALLFIFKIDCVAGWIVIVELFLFILFIILLISRPNVYHNPSGKFERVRLQDGISSATPIDELYEQKDK